MANPNTIPFYKYQDIQIPDVNLRQQFIQYMNNGQYNLALELLVDNQDQLAGKAFINDTINAITSGISKLENYYYQAVTIYLNNLKNDYQTDINNFKKINWQSSAQYYPNNFVIYNNQIYFCVEQPPVGTLPTDTDYWLYLGLRGANGAPGVDLVMRYQWGNNTAYNPNDLVVYDTDIYVALQSNTNVTPGTDPNTWLLFISVEKGEIFVGPNPPTVFIQNSLWFKTAPDFSTVTTLPYANGQLLRYNESINDWESLYPNVLFTMIDGIDSFRPVNKKVSITISQEDWRAGIFTYIDSSIDENSEIFIVPQIILNTQQTQLYDSLSIEIQDSQIKLVPSIPPNVSLPIIISIQ